MCARALYYYEREINTFMTCSSCVRCARVYFWDENFDDNIFFGATAHCIHIYAHAFPDTIFVDCRACQSQRRGEGIRRKWTKINCQTMFLWFLCIHIPYTCADRNDPLFLSSFLFLLVFFFSKMKFWHFSTVNSNVLLGDWSSSSINLRHFYFLYRSYYSRAWTKKI